VKRAADPGQARHHRHADAEGQRAYLAADGRPTRSSSRRFSGWKAGELRTLADYLEQVVTDVSRRPQL
jgi:hypothetical protein